jgi:hypothetical protein
MLKGKEYELLVEQIYRELSTDTVIEQNVSLYGVESSSNRQIDLTIRYNIFDMPVLTIVQAKDLSRKADIKIIDEFKSVIRDVRANKGILISNMGFTKKAKDYALKEGIEIYSAHSALKKRWELTTELPSIKYEDIYFLEFSPMLPVTGLEQIAMVENFMFRINDEIISKADMLNIAFKNHKPDKSYKWSKVKFEHDNLYCNQLNGEWRKVEDLDINYRYIQSEVKVSNISAQNYRLLKNHATGKITHSFVDLDLMLPKIVDTFIWTKKDVEKFDFKSPHLEVHSVNYGNVANFRYRFVNVRTGL